MVTEKGMGALQESSNVYADGSFRSCPALFTQVFTVHGLFRGHFFLAATCLLPDKREETYRIPERPFVTLNRERCLQAEGVSGGRWRPGSSTSMTNI